ncbi:MAG: YutD family protein [Lactovum sp.]
MVKEFPEELKNYNKYPGEEVILLGNQQIKIAEKNFLLVKNHKEAFDSQALEQRYSPILDKFDYIVGDWSYELLRLKGFYKIKRKKAEAEDKIDRLADYLQEYCTYGSAYFILERKRAQGEQDKPVLPDKEDLSPLKKINQKRKDNQKRRKKEINQRGFSTVRPDKPKATKKNSEQNKFSSTTNKRKKKTTVQTSEKKFVIRERKEN